MDYRIEPATSDYLIEPATSDYLIDKNLKRLQNACNVNKEF